MIKHVVMFKLQDFAEGATKEENARKIINLLESMPDSISEIKSLDCGINVAESERADDIVLITEFESLDDLNNYIIHPVHQGIADFIKKVRVESHVVDYYFG